MPTIIQLLAATVAVLLASRWLISVVLHKPRAGTALLVTRRSGIDVHFTTAFAVPLLHQVEVMDVSTKAISVRRSGKEGLHCRDDLRADVQVTFLVRVDDGAQNVRRAAKTVGCARASDLGQLEALMSPRLAEAMTTVARRFDFEELYARRQDFHDALVDAVSPVWDGYVLDHLTVDLVEQTPMSNLDSKTVTGARAIEKITKITSEKAIAVNEMERKWARISRTIDLELVELQRSRIDALEAFSRQTGRTQTDAQLEQQVQSRLRALVEEAVERRLGPTAATACGPSIQE